jgi:gliding motility-associated-like protein
MFRCINNIIFISLLIIDVVTLFAQPCLSGKEQNVWYFGANAGLDFNSGEPTVLSNGQLYNAESCASITNADGQLLMYTNGLTLWNANHQVMPNGSGLLGDPSSTQGAVIVPMPLNNNKYYIFTIDELAGYDGLRYSIVDMSLNGGLGDIQAADKNVLLQTNVTEKLTAVRHCNNKDIWIVSHDWENNTFRSYLITEAGIQTPVLTNIGVIHTGGSNPYYNTVGCMKISPDGKRIALAIRDMNLCQVLDFDNNTGTLSNVISLSSPNYAVIYGIEFSSDNSKLYVTSATNRKIYQFNLLAGNETAINASSTVIGQTASNYVFGLQRAPNGKIYVARTNGQWTGSYYLGVINQPNLLGTSCNYVDDGIYLGGQMSLLGLPNFMIENIDPIEIQGTTEVCIGDSPMFTATETCDNGISYTWTYSGLSSISNPNEPQTTIDFMDAGSGVLTLTTTSACGTSTGTMFINVSPCAPLPTAAFTAPITQTCLDNCLSFTDQSTDNPTAWQWTFEGATPNTSSAQNPSNICYSQAGTYNVQLIVSNNVGSDTLLLDDYVTISNNQINVNNITLCQGDSLLLQGQYQNQAGTYYDTIYYATNCYNINQTNLNLQVCNNNLTCQLVFPNAFSPNNDGVNDTFMPETNCLINSYDLWIYNRWGEELFWTNNPTDAWNGFYKGIKQELGVYVYRVQYTTLENGTVQTKNLKGNVSLIR